MARQGYYWLAILLILAVHRTGMGGVCEKCGAACEQSRLIKCTIKVPATVVETRMKSCVEYVCEERDETHTVFKRVPEKREIYKEVCYLEDEVKSKPITEKKCHRVEIPVSRTCKVKVPITETREGVRRYEICTDCGKVCVEEPCTCQVVRELDGYKSDCYDEQQIVFENTKRDMFYCVKTPKKKKDLVCEETAYKLVPVEKTRKVEVQIPKIVKQPVEVMVRKMVSKTIYCCEKCQCQH
jgi:hypothetical protein